MATGSNMITTQFLPVQDYHKFQGWLEQQDEETRQLYFGIAGSQHLIQSLVERIVETPEGHHFLVAKSGENWVGTIHIAAHADSVEFGVIVGAEHRGQGIAGRMMDQALVWARNRGYKKLYMHCLGWNKPIQHLCQKHGLQTTNMLGDTEAELALPPATWLTINQEYLSRIQALYQTWWKNTSMLYQEIYS